MLEEMNKDIDICERIYLLSTVQDVIDHIDSIEGCDDQTCDTDIILSELVEIFEKFGVQGQS